MSKNAVVVILVGYLCLISKQFSQQNQLTETLDEVVITATKFSTKKQHTGKVIQTISQQETPSTVWNISVKVVE